MKLVYFGANWCFTCKQLYPLVVKEMLRYNIAENSEKFEYVDVEQQMDRAMYNDICTLPCIQIEDDGGEVVERRVGMMNVTDIRKMCEKVGGKK